MTPTRPATAAHWLVLALLAGVVVLERSRTYAEPPDRDTAEYAVNGHEMLRGRLLYSDLWERKPPLLDWTFAGAERLVGYGPGEVFLVNVAAALATLAGCYAAGRAGGGATAGLVAAVLWTVVGGDPYLEANQPNAEVFVNAALTAAAAVLVAARPWTVRRTGLVAGGLFTLATMYEQHVVITCGTLAAAYVGAGAVAAGGPFESRAEVRRRAAAMGVAAGVGAVVWGGLAGYYLAVGRLSAAADDLFRQVVGHATLTTSLRVGLDPDFLVPGFLAWVRLPALLVLLAAVRAEATADADPGRPTAKWWVARPWVVWAGWAVGTWFVVVLPGLFFPHYYQCWIPPACVAGGWAAGRLLGAPRGRFAVLRPAAVLAVLGLLVRRELPPYQQWTPDEWSARTFRGDNFVEQSRLAPRLSAVLGPGERFWVMGSDTPLYLLTGQSPVTGLMFVEPLAGDPAAPGWARLTADLTRARPALILVRLVYQSDVPDPSPLWSWIRANYVRVDPGWPFRSYSYWVRRDDADLLRRLRDPSPAAIRPVPAR